ncbi:Zn-dependent alcohol dehydrogenase [Nocardioides sp. 1609]|uniref:Zn-dependent alcohol dehydrogenase n=1 Tax=Nocardioides sp. 1609 TaxID=2508327 RepID=UPI00107035DD|nr:Zn-dependent alcohol dehydrogenase [Nocardioides sp. 1609]
MRAAVMHDTNQSFTIENIQPRDPGPDDVVVRLEATGVCHSDISATRGFLRIAPPAVLGHEAAGVVEDIGSNVQGIVKGDRIVASLVPVCGNCYWCVNGQTHLCAETDAVRGTVRAELADGRPVTTMLGLGAFAEYMTIDRRLAVKIESELPSEQLALIGCGIATGAGAAMFTAKVSAGSSVAVIGCGGVGQSVIQGARLRGAARIIAVDPIALKRTVSLGLGATDTVDPTLADTAEQVRELTGGRGVDFAFEVVGSPATVTVAYECARRGGVVTTVGIPAPTARLDLPASDFFRAEKHLIGSYYGSTQVRSDFQRFVDLIEAGRLDAEGLITTRYGLDALPSAFTDLEAGHTIRGMVTFP